MPINPDEHYLRSREELLDYEDSRFQSLITSVANFYVTRNDQSIWGEFLRAIAIELARIEYMYAYELVNKEPVYLTPPDIRRRWADPLSVSRSYPTKDQFDRDFKTMLADLLVAYRKGAKLTTLSEVIQAYTGKNIQVQELFKLIGTFYDESDRNTIRVAVNVGGSNPFTDIQNLVQLQQVTRDLYGALDLAKPAHVGLHLTTIFGSDETVALDITDTLRIYVKLQEAEPLDDPLWQAPHLDPNTPDTRLAAYGSLFPLVLSGGQYATYPASIQAEYTFDGTNWNLKDEALKWVFLKDNNGTITGEISKDPDAVIQHGVLSPQLNTIWEITDEQDSIFELD